MSKFTPCFLSALWFLLITLQWKILEQRWLHPYVEKHKKNMDQNTLERNWLKVKSRTIRYLILILFSTKTLKSRPRTPKVWKNVKMQRIAKKKLYHHWSVLWVKHWFTYAQKYSMLFINPFLTYIRSYLHEGHRISCTNPHNTTTRSLRQLKTIFLGRLCLINQSITCSGIRKIGNNGWGPT